MQAITALTFRAVFIIVLQESLLKCTLSDLREESLLQPNPNTNELRAETVNLGREAARKRTPRRDLRIKSNRTGWNDGTPAVERNLGDGARRIKSECQPVRLYSYCLAHAAS